MIEKVVFRPVRRKLPDERASITHKFSIGGHEGYITVGMYEDGTPGEIFITMAKEGSTISGLMDSFATSISYNLQYGVPLKFLVDKFGHVRFEPSGWTGNPQIPYAKSIPDYIFRWLGAKFLGPEYAVTEAGDAPILRPTEPDSPAGVAVPAVGLRRAAVLRMRRHDDPQRKLLQVRKLRRHQRLLVSSDRSPPFQAARCLGRLSPLRVFLPLCDKRLGRDRFRQYRRYQLIQTHVFPLRQPRQLLVQAPRNPLKPFSPG